MLFNSHSMPIFNKDPKRELLRKVVDVTWTVRMCLGCTPTVGLSREHRAGASLKRYLMVGVMAGKFACPELGCDDHGKDLIVSNKLRKVKSAITWVLALQ